MGSYSSEEGHAEHPPKITHGPAEGRKPGGQKAAVPAGMAGFVGEEAVPSGFLPTQTQTQLEPGLANRSQRAKST